MKDVDEREIANCNAAFVGQKRISSSMCYSGRKLLFHSTISDLSCKLIQNYRKLYVSDREMVNSKYFATIAILDENYHSKPKSL